MSLREFDEKAAKLLARMNARNAVCPINEVDSDVDYYSDLGKHDGILLGARWQFQQDQVAFDLQDNRIAELEAALKSAKTLDSILSDNGEIVALETKVAELTEVIKQMRRHCLCTRNVTGFDYHENHLILGKPNSGSRWLTPADIADKALARAAQGVNGEG